LSKICVWHFAQKALRFSTIFFGLWKLSRNFASKIVYFGYLQIAADLL